MKEKMIKNIKLIVTIAIVLFFVWFLVLSPMITFHNNEKKLENAARRYFELNSNQLPTGERIKTVKLSTLYHKSYIEGDLFIPHTHKTCSIDNSWVKVRRENGEYKYYTYLECGILSSTIDHKGPEIKLKGNMEETVDVGSEFKDPGVKSVVDNVDGSMKTDTVTVKSNVDTSKVGVYEITYTAFDSLSNKTEVTRTVNVVKTFYSTVKTSLGDRTNYIGLPEDNYVRLSNILFRIYGIDKDKNVILVSDEDIANVSYVKLDKWLDYFYDQLNDTTKKMIVKKKYCNMDLTETTLDTTQCNGYTKERAVYVPSVIDINLAKQGGTSFMETNTISWTANAMDIETAFATRNEFYEEDYGKDFVLFSSYYNYGVRPMFTISGKTLIKGGTGTVIDPYTFGDVKKAKGGSLVNERFTGEFVSIDGNKYRIIKTEKDGTTKVISQFTVGVSTEGSLIFASATSQKIVYDPKDTSSVAYQINNKVPKYIDTSYFVNHEVEVPIYKDMISYGDEVDTKKVKVKLSAPNMFEMFAAQPQGGEASGSYWLINSSKADRFCGAIFDIGVPLNEPIPETTGLYARVVGYLKKGTVISNGDGTRESPYVIK